MKIQRIAIGLSVVNLALLMFLLAQIRDGGAQKVAPVRGGLGLEVVDAQGQCRAEILVHGPETVNGKTYPETVLFRMATAQQAPLMKLTVSEDGSALGLSDDSQPGGIELRANRNKGTFVKIVNRDGREQTIKP